MRRLLLAALFALPCSTSHAADQTIRGELLVVKGAPAVAKRKVVFKAKEVGSPNTLVGNPVVGGATFIVSANGGLPSTQTFNLATGTSPSTGKPFWSGDAAQGYRYKDGEGDNGPVKTLRIRKTPSGVFKLKGVIEGKLGIVDIVPPTPGTDGCLLLAITGGDSYSMKFADGTVTNKSDLFKVKKPTTEGTCVPATPVCGNGLIESGEQCDGPGTSCGGSAVCSTDCTCPCDFLDTADCLFPFPSDYLTKADPDTDTGRRVHFAVASMPKNVGNVPVEPADYRLSDGFSPGASILLHVPNVDLGVTGAAPITDIERSLDAGAPIVIINASSLTRHLFFAELDANAGSDASRSLILRPGVNFAEGNRYIVALRQMKNSAGQVIPASPEFAVYRDATPTADPVKEARRAHMEDLFTTLANAGIARNDLYLAWDFTVASQRNITERLLFMRDDAFARLGSAAPAFTVTQVDDEVDDRIFRRVTGTFEVERYVDSTAPGARFVLDANGLPTHQATPQVADFICNIPRAALANAGATAVPARASIYGHGLLGSHTEVSSGNVRSMANEHNFVFCATKWIGMANEDVPNAVSILQDLSKFPSLTDRLQQAMIDMLFLARLMIHPNGFVAHSAFKDSFGTAVIDTSNVFYDGNSQGGIFGGTVMAIAQDITRGVLGVPGMNYSLLLTRSIDFAAYSAILYPSYPNELQRPLILALIQMLWDRSEPNGYARHITNDPLPNTPSHEVLLHLAFGDHQVANVATEIQARTIGASIHAPTIAPGRHSDVNPYFGIPTIASYPFDGSALIIWDSGAATPPIENLAPSVGDDPHSDPRNFVDARTQKSEFLKAGGAVIDVCPGIPCVAP